MLIDFLCPDNYGFYNIKIAHKLGLECSVYLSSIMSYFKEGQEFIEIDSDKIKYKTSIEKNRQEELKQILIDLGVLVQDTDNKNLCKMNFDVILSILDEKNENAVQNIVSIAVPKKKTKSEAIKTELKKYIETTNKELRDAYSDWIDGVFSRQGWMSKKSVINGQKLVDSYSKRNLDLALELLNIAAIGGYRDIQWSINDYEKNKNKSTNISNRNNYNIPYTNNARCFDVSTEVF